MTIDTRLVNARLVESSGVHERSLSIHEGRLVPDQDTDDVWRTVNASGYLVIPGIIQPALSWGDTALTWAKRGTTSAIAPNIHENGSGGHEAYFDWIEPAVVTNAGQIHEAIERGARVILPFGFAPNESLDASGETVIRLAGSGADIEAWHRSTSARLVVRIDDAGTLGLREDERVAIEIPGPSLVGRNSDHLWEIVLEDGDVLVTSGDDPNFPLLQFLHQEGHVKRGLRRERIAEVVSLNAAKVYGLDRKCGFADGNDGDLVVFDPDSEDPYLDSPWPGRVIFSLQRGNILLYNGQLHTSPGDGLRLGLP